MSLTKRRMGAVIAATALLATVGFASPAYAIPNNNSVKKLTQAVTAEGVLEHLQAFQDIADEHGDRAAGREGYAASVDYVVGQLEAAGYTPEVQEFDFPYFEENSELIRVDPQPTTWVHGQDFLRNQFDSGIPEGTATGTLVPVDLVEPFPADGSSTSGCDDADWTGFPEGGIALVQRGTCGFAQKALMAEAAGAAAVIISNDGREGLVGMIGDATGLTIPAVFVISSVGEDLAGTPGATVTVTVDYQTETRTAYNVFAETGHKPGKGNANDTVVMAGAHLDSVQDGAGINDNGSGSAALLEVAIQMQKVKPVNNVRFAWWGAEEEGLLGSEHYVANLTPEEVENIALYLNFDMVASPNYMFGVYDGDDSSGTATVDIPAGSAEIEDVFEQFYDAGGHPFQDTEFSGRSDYGPFIAVGIPAGGLFTGAEGVKTDDEAALYGGVAGASYDPCYHQPCDNLTGEGQDAALYAQLAEDYELVGNINVHALDVNADAIAAAVITFAFDASTVTEAGEEAAAGLRTFSTGSSVDLNALRDRFAS